MKTVIVIVLSIILAFSGGLLIYGATLGDPVSIGADLGDLTPPTAPDEYAHGIAEWIEANAAQAGSFGETFMVETNPSKDPAVFAAEVDGWYDVFGKHDPASNILTRYSGADLVPNLIVPITYNQNRSKQFCMTSHFLINAGDQRVYSDNMRVRAQIAPFQVDAYYLSRAWAGSPTRSSAALRVYYGAQSLMYTGIGAIDSYDESTGEYEVIFGKPKETARNRDLDREIPYKTYGLLSLPIYLGQTSLDGSVVDGATVKVESPTPAKPYYTMTFSENVSSAQTDVNIYDRLNAALGNQMSDITLKKADFTVEIWESGVFRRIAAEFDVDADVKGNKGDAHVSMEYRFYYDDDSCNVPALIDSVGWTKYLDESKPLPASYKNEK